MNDGVVVCTEFNFNFLISHFYWRFMTLEAPWDNSHPVSGTREFGIDKNPDGTYNIYVRGVDRFTSILQQLVAYLAMDGNPFQKADNLWKSFQNNVANYINKKGGKATVLTPVTNRIDWEKVKEVLEGTKPVSSLGC